MFSHFQVDCVAATLFADSLTDLAQGFRIGIGNSDNGCRFTLCTIDGTLFFTFGLGDFGFALAVGDIDLFLIVGPSIREIIERYTDLTGKSVMLPKAALGYLGSSMYYPELPENSDDAVLAPGSGRIATFSCASSSSCRRGCAPSAGPKSEYIS